MPALTAIVAALTNLAVWNKEDIHQTIVSVSEKLAVKLGKIAQPLRVAVTGNTISPPMDITLVLLGRERTLKRLNAALILCEAPKN